MISFGAGTLSATPVVGSLATFAILQDVQLDLSFAEKMLYGAKQFAVDVARGQGKISIKAKNAEVKAAMFNDLFMGGAAVVAGATTTVTVTNQPMGTTPFFSLSFSLPYQNKTVTFTFPKCTSTKLGMGFKNEDYTIPELDITAVADASGNLYTYVVQE